MKSQKCGKVLSILLVCLMLFSTACGSKNDTDASNAGGSQDSAAADKSESPDASAAKEENVKLKLLLPVWDDTRKGIYEDIKENIQNEFPDYDIELEEYSDVSKLKTYNATSDMPDVFFTGSMTETQSIMEANHCLDMLPYLNEDGFLDNYTIDSLKQPWTDGKFYTLSSGSDSFYTPRVFVNKDVFETCGVELPKTFEDLVSACKVFNSKGIVPITSQTLDGQAVGMLLWQNFAAAEDPQTVLDFYDGKIGFTDEKVVSAFDKVAQLADAGAFAPGCTQMDYGASVQMFKSKAAAMYIMFTWALADVEDLENETVDYIDWPRMNEEINPADYLQAWGGPLSGYGVSADTEFPEAAVKVAEYCVMREAQYFNESAKTMTGLNTGIEITGLSPLMEKNVTGFANAANKLPSVQFMYSSSVMEEMAIQGGKLLIGGYSAKEACEAVEAVRVKQ